MKIIPFLFSLMLIFTACSNNRTADNSTQTTDTLTKNDGPSSETLCFQRLEGTSNQDTSSIRLVINGKEVSGDFSYIPYEKDSRKGTITGKRDGDIIKGIWAYMQEGMTETLDLELKLNGNTLLQKNYSLDPKTGRQVLTDGSTFSIEYKKIECK